ncbi:hypothetical protein [Microcoleus sp. herbarium12]|uniref:hypothetical protein n=1 Tax=Microcoleus sp. herbarium12 TaxID=3055437 RepID=UPI002FD21C53
MIKSVWRSGKQIQKLIQYRRIDIYFDDRKSGRSQIDSYSQASDRLARESKLICTCIKIY